MIKKALYIPVAILFIALLWNLDLVVYGLKQAKGQLHIVWNARPVDEYLQDPAVADSVKQRLLFVQEVRQYAIDSLGLNNSDNYTTMFDQKGKPILWVVTACAPYALEPKQWHFPVVGDMPYKGFFNEADAHEEMEEIRASGQDVGIRTVGGWSTLGWFKDPILSNMLSRSRGDLANLIFHELVHATIFVKDSVDFNENLASFIADHATYNFLASKYGLSSRQYVNYKVEMNDESAYISHILRGADKLDSLYHLIESDEADVKKRKKDDLVNQIILNADTLSLNNTSYLKNIRGRQPNNTYFMSFMRYRSKQDELDKLYIDKFNRDLIPFINYLKNKHPYL